MFQAVASSEPSAYVNVNRVADFADLAILELGLTDQRREAVAASQWLDFDDRQLLFNGNARRVYRL